MTSQDGNAANGPVCTCYAFILAGGKAERRSLHCPVHGQTVASVGQPSDVAEAGRLAVQEFAADLRRLADA